jgi:hypothetical protein
MRAMAFWVQPQGDPLPRGLLKEVMDEFFEFFPEYQGVLRPIQSPRPPYPAFFVVEGECQGLWPSAASYLKDLLEATFPQAKVRVYGKRDLPTDRS